MNFELTGLFVYKNVVSLGYPVLESYLSVYPMLDEALICVDPTSDDETMRLCHALEKKFSNVRLFYFEWPKVTLDGSAIGIATQYALAQVRTTHAVNVQADECWSPPLMEWTRDNWKDGAQKGLECLRHKVLHTEHNAQQFQGGDQWNGVKDMTPGSPWYWQKGAGYNESIKLFKKCPAISISHDGWSVDGCGTVYHSRTSNEWPIVHLHDFFRDHYIALRKNAGYNLWTDQQKYGNYKADADRIEATKDEWYDDPMWTRTTSPFGELLPWYAKRLIGRTSYSVDYDLLGGWNG